VLHIDITAEIFEQLNEIADVLRPPLVFKPRMGVTAGKQDVY
jgi:hypothetical protein